MTGCPVLRQKLCDDSGKRCNGIGDMNTAAVKRAGEVRLSFGGKIPSFSLLDAREDYPEPFYMLEYNGVPFSTLGGIQAISGQKKNGKTFVLAQLMAAVLGPDAPNVHENLPGLTIPQRTLEHLGHLPRVLYVDTEMEKLNSAKVLRRVHWLCGWPMNEPNDRLSVLWMRTI